MDGDGSLYHLDQPRRLDQSCPQREVLSFYEAVDTVDEIDSQVVMNCEIVGEKDEGCWNSTEEMSGLNY